MFEGSKNTAMCTAILCLSWTRSACVVGVLYILSLPFSALHWQWMNQHSSNRRGESSDLMWKSTSVAQILTESYGASKWYYLHITRCSDPLMCFGSLLTQRLCVNTETVCLYPSLFVVQCQLLALMDVPYSLVVNYLITWNQNVFWWTTKINFFLVPISCFVYNRTLKH